MIASILSIAVPLTILAAGSPLQTDTMATAKGQVQITAIGHGTLMFHFGRTVVHVDPVGRYADYSRLPKADIILITHEHGDHLDKKAVAQIATGDTVILLTAASKKLLGLSSKRGIVMDNGDVKTVAGLKIEAVAAYNIVHQRAPGQPFHPKGAGNGYVISFSGKRFYVAGDTENIPEMAKLGPIPTSRIDVAFLPMNLPYTMTPEMAAAAARVIRPKILYPYHFGKTDTSKLVELLKGTDIEVRIRNLQ